MHRCATLALLAASACFMVSASAQTGRQFPAHALRGELRITQPPEALLNGAPVRLAPGARIRDSRNMLLMSGALVDRPLVVHYTFDTLGLVHDVWVLSEDELARRPWPTTLAQARSWTFNTAAQTWTRP